ncbi:MAG TPA: dihydrolipoyl dehydrogenase [Desulfobacterales bacterium]
MAESQKYDLVIIGSGPGGYVAAVHAAQLGMKVACVEKESRLGGVCLRVGCIPSKALLDSSEFYHMAREEFAAHGIKTGKVSLDLEAMMARKDKVVETLTDGVRGLLKRNKVDVVQGTASLAGKNSVEVAENGDGSKKRKLEAGAILLATGSRAIEVPGMEFDGTSIVNSSQALAFDKVPKTLGIVGGGYIGLELGSVWRRLGSEVTVIEMLPNIATNLDGQVGRSLQRMLKKQGMTFRMKTKVTAAKIVGKTKKVEVTLDAGGEEETLKFDRLLVAVGRRPRTEGLNLEEVGVKTDEKTGQVQVDGQYRTSVESIYAIGDLIAGPMLAHKASAEGVAAVECIAGKPGEVNYDTIPAIIYTWPEVAAVGMTEEQLKERDIPYRSGAYPFTGNGRALCLGAAEGLVKVLCHKKTDRLLGVHIIGARAAEMIAECVVAMEFDASAEDLARTVHSHPSFSEALQEAAAAAASK